MTLARTIAMVFGVVTAFHATRAKDPLVAELRLNRAIAWAEVAR